MYPKILYGPLSYLQTAPSSPPRAPSRALPAWAPSWAPVFTPGAGVGAGERCRGSGSGVWGLGFRGSRCALWDLAVTNGLGNLLLTGYNRAILGLVRGYSTVVQDLRTNFWV